MVPDFINGVFEAGATIALFAHVRALYRAKEVKGVSAGSFAFFASWGIWNLFYYPHLGQILSFYAGLGVVTMNVTWVVLAWRYSR